jgi:uncharacterized protein (TIGR02996 family)
MMDSALQPEERAFLTRLTTHADDDAARLEYADWLTQRGDPRGEFLRRFVAAAATMDAAGFPEPAAGFPEEWLELVGFRLVQRLAQHNCPELKDPLLRLARPALRLVKTEADDNNLPVGASKIGGLPDLPPDAAWPEGRECRATYNLDTEGVERPAGFLCQINLAEIAGTQAARVLPDRGLLSFFSYVNWKNPDVIGALALYFPDATRLARRPIPENFTQGNRVMPPQRLTFLETLDIPDLSSPWRDDFVTDRQRMDHYQQHVFWPIQKLNQENFLGYGKTFQEADPTPSKTSRHLLMLYNVLGMTLHIQIPSDDLAARNFSAITLNWVDFD